MVRILPVLTSLLIVTPHPPGVWVQAEPARDANRAFNQAAFPGDFDFLIGEWNVINRRLSQRLADNNDWLEYASTCRFWKILDGMVVQDECVTVRNGATHTGGSYRIYNPATREWTVYWASTAFPQLGLLPQVRGTMQNDSGELFGQERFEGRTVRLRFRWRRVSDSEAYWEQAYFDTRNATWETNWTMRFTRR